MFQNPRGLLKGLCGLLHPPCGLLQPLSGLLGCRVCFCVLYQGRKLRQRTKTKNDYKEPRRETKTGTKTGIEDRELRQGTKTGNEHREQIIRTDIREQEKTKKEKSLLGFRKSFAIKKKKNSLTVFRNSFPGLKKRKKWKSKKNYWLPSTAYPVSETFEKSVSKMALPFFSWAVDVGSKVV